MWWDLVLDLFYSFIFVSTDFDFFLGLSWELRLKLKPIWDFPRIFLYFRPFYFILLF